MQHKPEERQRQSHKKKVDKEALSPRRFKREHSLADQSASDVNSSHQSKGRRFRLKQRGADSNSKMDLSSNNSGLMSRTGKGRLKGRGKDGKGGSMSMVIKQEAILTKLQEELMQHKQYCITEFTRVDKEQAERISSLESRVNEK